MTRKIAVVFYGYRLKGNWRPPVLDRNPTDFITDLSTSYEKYGITVTYIEEPHNILDVRGYADLLNTVRLRTDDNQLGNPCLGHIIGQSQNCNLLEDLQRGISRVAFAPETIEPDGSSKQICHNCGCGC